MRAKELRCFVMACIGIPTSIIFCISLLTFITIAEDLDKRIIKQENYIKELELELKQTEMICIK